MIMKIVKIILTSVILLVIVASCRDPYVDLTTDATQVLFGVDKKIWLLQNRRYANSGIDLYNETTGALEVELDLPEGIESAHALAYDGEFLWVGGIGENESLYKLDPQTGGTISEIPNIRTEGIAVDGNYLYYSVYETNTINKIKKDGVFVETITVKNIDYDQTIKDIAIDGDNLYYLRYLSYTETQPIVKINLSDKDESLVALSESIDTYSLTIFNGEIVGVTSTNYISRFNQFPGDLISSNPVHEDSENSWITAIAPYYEIEGSEE